jgi:hypothetical protein
MSESIRVPMLRFSPSAALLAFLIVPMVASAQTSPAYIDPGEVRVDDEKGPSS